MSDLIVLGFEDEPSADAFIQKLGAMQKEHIIGLDDVVKVYVRPDGKPKIKQGIPLVAGGALSGAFWGMLIGMIFFAPFAGAAIGAATGALSGSMADYGIDDDFIKKVGSNVQPGQAAVFLLVNKSTPDKIAAEIAGTKAEVIKTSLSDEAEAELREMFQS